MSFPKQPSARAQQPVLTTASSPPSSPGPPCALQTRDLPSDARDYSSPTLAGPPWPLPNPSPPPRRAFLKFYILSDTALRPSTTTCANNRLVPSTLAGAALCPANQGSPQRRPILLVAHPCWASLGFPGPPSAAGHPCPLPKVALYLLNLAVSHTCSPNFIRPEAKQQHTTYHAIAV